MSSIKSATQQLVRRFHLRAMRRGLPPRLALYLHELEPAEWEAFAELCAWLVDRQYRFATPEEYLEPGPSRLALITFDDNYRSWFEALSLLDHCGVRATFYVNSGPLRDRTEAFDVEAYYDRLAHGGDRTPLDASELREIADRGHVIGGHTHSHPVLSDLRVDEAKREIRRANAILEEILGRPIRHFSYPFGMRRHFTAELREHCADSGLTVANGIPGMLHREPTAESIDRSPWRFDRSLEYNSRNLEVDGRIFERLTGRAAVV